LRLDRQDFAHHRQRQRKRLIAEQHQQHRQDGQRQRQRDDENRALARLGTNLDRAVELLDVGLDHIHADTAPGHVRRLRHGRETGQEDQIEALPVVQRIGFFLGDQALFDRLGANPLGLMPRPSSAMIRTM
jgi:hypothetical protein